VQVKLIDLCLMSAGMDDQCMRNAVGKNSRHRGGTLKRSSVVMAALCLTFLIGVDTHGFGAGAEGETASANPPSVPTFSTENIGRQGHFYVGGKWVGEPGKHMMRGAMYVEVWIPKKVKHPYPVLFMQAGGGQTNIALLQTPDGRPGWAYDFVNQGYTVYMMDFPGRGRAGFVPGYDGEMVPPRSGELMEEVWTNGAKSSNPLRNWPQQDKYSQWPSDAPNKGKMGDPVFDYFAKTEVPFPSSDDMEQLAADDVVQLVDMIRQPVILLLHSRLATSGWLVADARPKQVKAILAVEPWAPPIVNAELDARGPGRVWGLTNFPVHYDPPIKAASELQTVPQEKADGPGLIPCWVQKEPAKKLINLEGIPVLNVSGEASYHRPYAHCVAKWLNQAGVKTKYVNLEDVGLSGNGHQMMSEKNSGEIAKFLMSWLDETVR
jgi:pimeloyl-ACP methyl ester carboxylesterase